MRWWKCATVVLALLVVALATDRVLREADVIRWGTAGTTLDRIDTVEEGNAAVEERVRALEEAESALSGSALSRVLGRIAVLEDRIAALERQTAQVAPAGVAGLEERIAAIERQANLFSSILDRIAGQENRIVALEGRLTTPVDQFVVVGTDVTVQRVCITYTTAEGFYESCRTVRFTDDGRAADAWTQATMDCIIHAVIGEPLPDCWR
jgi:hypothetical protein